tara:strand:- start:21 stop:242 length:222 start_codon:yes stop_codon:yes gene_type:complete
MKKSRIIKMVKEILDEISTTGAVAGYQTPFAFSKGNKKNRATKYAEKLGYKVTKRKKRPHNTKMFDYLDENID